jgi:hypothetical protein
MKTTLLVFSILLLAYISKAQNVGINTATPTYELDVEGNIGHNQYMYHNGDGDTYWRFTNNDQIQIRAGNVRMIDIIEGGNDYIVFNEGGNNVDFRVETNNIANMLVVDGSADQVIVNRATQHLGYTDQFSGYSNDNVSNPFIINGWSQGTTGGGATFNIASAANGYKTLESTTSGTGSAIWGWHTATSGSGIGVEGTTASTIVGWAGFFSGDVGCTGSYLGSDKRWKKNIKNLSEDQVLDKIMKLRPTKYEWEAEKYPGMSFNPEKTSYGFIAQEMDEIFPDLVENNKYIPDPTQAHENRAKSKNVTGFYMVDYVGMIPVLTQAIQEQQLMITEQNDKIEKQNKQIELLLQITEELRAKISQ